MTVKVYVVQQRSSYVIIRDIVGQNKINTGQNITKYTLFALEELVCDY